jgi:hypothetical protein
MLKTDDPSAIKAFAALRAAERHSLNYSVCPLVFAVEKEIPAHAEVY